DYEDFARAFAGVGKARAVALWNGEDRLVHITIASATGEPVEETSDLYENLVLAIDGARNPVEAVMVQSFQPLHFNLTARLIIDERYLFEEVREEVRLALEEAFGFDAREFGKDVTAAEVVTVIQGVEGVVAVDLDALYLATEDETSSEATLTTRLASESTRWEDDEILPGQLLLVNPVGITIEEVES